MNKETIIIEDRRFRDCSLQTRAWRGFGCHCVFILAGHGGRLDGTSSSTRSGWIMERRC